MGKVLATISLLSKDRQANSGRINDILTEHSNLIMARMGVNVQKTCTEKCPGMILLAIEGQRSDWLKLEEKLKEVKNLIVKSNLLEEKL